MLILSVKKLRFQDNYLRRKLFPKLNPNPDPNPNSYREAIFLRGNCPDTRNYITFCVMFISKRRNKYCNLLFLAICCSQFPVLIFLGSSFQYFQFASCCVCCFPPSGATSPVDERFHTVKRVEVWNRFFNLLTQHSIGQCKLRIAGKCYSNIK